MRVELIQIDLIRQQKVKSKRFEFIDYSSVGSHNRCITEQLLVADISIAFGQA